MLGSEVDGWVTYRVLPPLEIVGGYSLLAMGDAARGILAAVENESVLKGTGTLVPATVAHFGYLQATLRIP